MAKVQMKLPEEFLLRLSRLGDKTDEIIPKMLDAGGEVVVAKVKSNLQGVIGQGEEKDRVTTGELAASLGVSPADIDREGVHNVKVGFNEPRRKQNDAKGKRSYHVRTNAMIANVLEYGKSGQPPRPFLAPAKSAARKPCTEAMKAVFEEEVKKL